MSAADEEQTPRAGTYADLARRMDRMELRHEDLAREVGALTATTTQVVLNQKHAEEINDLRFKSLDIAVGQIGTDLKGFMARIEGIIAGDVQTAQSRQGAELVEDYQLWRKETDHRVSTLEDSAMRQQGVFATFGATKTFVLAVAAVAGPAIAIITLVLK